MAFLSALPLWVGSSGGGRLVMLCEHTTDICVISVFRRLSGLRWYYYRLHPVGRLYALYLRSDGSRGRGWYLIPHTQIRTVGAQNI